MPYTFTTSGLSATVGSSSAKAVKIGHSASNSTEFTYSDTDKRYYMSKNGTASGDLLTDKKLSYDNLFILLSDSVTYETENATQSVIDTISGGKGYYISGGQMSEITWSKDSSGSLLFLDSAGQKLVINPGTSYIGFTKSSQAGEIKIK